MRFPAPCDSRLGRLVRLAVAIHLCLPGGRLLGQLPVEPVFVPSSVVPSDASNSERERLYTEVQSEFAALDRQGSLLKKVVRLVRPAVVHLESVKADAPTKSAVRSDPRMPPTIEEAGSGVIIEIADVKYVLTNRHVIRDARLSDITIRLYDGRLVKPVRVWSDPDTDVAVIQIVYSGEVIEARLGDSDQIDIGDFVLAVGSPFGLSHSVSYGIVSAKGRRDLELGTDYVRLQDFLQTDAAINPGNSGGPLVSLRGEVIGINTAIASNSGGNEGVSFAVPINLAMFVARQLISQGAVEHAYLGVQLDNQFDLEKAISIGVDHVRGALVKGVTPRSPAYFAQLQAHDLIVNFNGVNVEDDDHLVNLVSLTPIDSTVPVEIIRQTKRIAVQVKVGNRRHFEIQAK